MRASTKYIVLGTQIAAHDLAATSTRHYFRQSFATSAIVSAECRSRSVCVLCSAANACFGVRAMTRSAQPRRQSPSPSFVAVKLNRCSCCVDLMVSEIRSSGTMLMLPRNAGSKHGYMNTQDSPT